MKIAGIIILVLAVIIFIVIICLFINNEKTEPISAIFIFLLLLCFGSVLLSKGSYEQGAKDAINGKVKYEIVQYDKIIIKNK